MYSTWGPESGDFAAGMRGSPYDPCVGTYVLVPCLFGVEITVSVEYTAYSVARCDPTTVYTWLR